MRFLYSNIKFKKHEQENSLVVTGEITNDTGRHYNAVVFRFVLFIKTVPVGNITIAIKGFRDGQTKTFEARIADLDYRMMHKITRYDIYPESAY